MGLAGQAASGAASQPTEKLLTSDPSRPPRLSRRERDSYCFHLEFSAESQYILPNLKYSAFLDINVTHIITDKPIATVQNSAMVHFLQKIIESYSRTSVRHPQRPPMSPSLRRAANELNHSRDLSHMLAEEKRRGAAAPIARGGRVLTPLYNAGTGAVNLFNQQNRTNREPPVVVAPIEGRLLGSIGDKKVVYEQFRSPFVLLEEITHTFAPVYKEYPPNATEMCTYPMLHFGSHEFHCPWLVRHSGPQQLPQPHIPTAPSKPILVPAGQKHRVAKTIRTLAQHRVLAEEQAGKRPKLPLRGMGQAPLPPITGSVRANATGERPRPGFCECCYEKYSNLEKHLNRDTHRKLVCTGEFYRSVDRVLGTLIRPAAKYSYEENLSQPLDAPPSPAKSVVGMHPMRIKSIPLKNITNQIPFPVNNATKPIAAHVMDEVDVESDSPIYSSPSLKRRRSQRLVGRSSGRATARFVL
ncbi:hypothetical protein PSACC_01401 [Paramicrosporidium saccamoebae]|uniref:DBF4-type domain-containing protein n=1 Tax=Paramicrosporidium saccamoebae TaxID=1246581 RepID=A0A2H9TM28_9FUNG|nr:hypothetical protein PSACC_01401 [Paramicrosporidium saccamoebae]